MNIISALPFFHGSCKSKDNGGFPHVLPIDIFYDDELKMFRCHETDMLVKTLNEVYLQGSLVDGSISSESGKGYISRLVDLILSCGDLKPDAKILEIGFGKGIILKNLKELGYHNLIGIEPGNHKLLSGIEDIELINDFFPSKKITGSLDVIYHFAVWEHVSNPVNFIKEQLAHLSPGGSIIFGVPNCEPNVRNGDLSMFLHEHYSYFTPESIEQTVIKANGNLDYIKVIDGMLVGRITEGTGTNKKTGDDNLNSTIEKDDYWHKVSHLENAIKRFFHSYERESDVAVYVPGRCLNALYLLGLKNVRLVDDSSEMKNRFLPYFENSVESFEDLCSKPPRAVLIYSNTFGEKIKQKCVNDNRLLDTMVVTIDEII